MEEIKIEMRHNGNRVTDRWKARKNKEGKLNKKR